MALQIKSGESRFGEQVPGGWRFRIDASHVEYWRGYSMPVVLVLYSPSRDAAFWQVVNRDTTQSTGAHFAVDVPEGNLFDARSGRDLEAVARADNETADGLRDRRTDADLPWMWMLDEGARLFLEVEQNLLSADGRCVLRMIAEGSASENSVVRTWPWAFLATNNFKDELLRLFPWADKQVDEPWYRERAVGEFVSEHGNWNLEEEAYDLDEDFDAWWKGRFEGVVAPYATTFDGGTALWRLELKLNAKGEEALERDKGEMIEEAVFGAELEAERDSAIREGYYTVEAVETYARDLYNLVFVYGNEEEVKESLLIEPQLFDGSDGLIPEAVEAILRHRCNTGPTHAWSRAFNQRFLAELVEEKITAEDIDGWLRELRGIGQRRGL